MHIFSSRLLSRTMVSLNRTNIAINDIAAPGFTFPMERFSDFSGGFGSYSISGLTSWGGGATNPKRNVQNNYQVKQDFTYSLSNHSLKFGFHFDRFQVNQRSEARGFGTFSFGGLEEFFANDVDRSTFIRPGSDTIRGYRQSLFAFYLQDDISLTDRLTLNLGLRYEATNTPTEANGKVANIRDTTEAFLYSATVDDVSVGDPWYQNPSLKNFAPKVGLAWDVFGTGKTSLRAGVGLWHDLVLTDNLLTWGVRQPPFFVNVFLESGPNVKIHFPDVYFTQPELIFGPSGLARADGTQWNPEQPKVYKWSMDIEQELAQNLSVKVGYSGTRGVHLQRGPLRLITNLAEMRPHPDGGMRRFVMTQPGSYPSKHFSFFRWNYMDGTSTYNAFRLNVNKRFSQGFQFQTSYTFSRSTDDGSNWTGSNDFQSTIRGYRDEKLHALSAFDFRHNFSSHFLVNLPGQNLTGAAGVILGGWQLGGLVRLNSGFPLVVEAQQPRPGGRGQVANVEGREVDLIPGGNNNPINDGGRNPDQYFDIGQFKPMHVVENGPTDNGFFEGNLGSNTLISPGIANMDISFTKNTRLPFLGEAGSLQFRAEFFNILNRPNFGDPAMDIFRRPRTGSRLAGDLANPRLRSDAARIDTTRTTSRELQFGLKMIF